MSARWFVLAVATGVLSLGGCPQKTPTATSGTAQSDPAATPAAAPAAAATAGYSMTDDGRMIAPDGSIQAVDVAGYPMFDAEGNPIWEPPPAEQAKQLFEEAVMLQKGIAGAAPNDAAALERLSRAVTLVPDFAEAWYSLGRLQLKLNDLENAKVSLKKAIQFAPENADGYLALALAMERAGEFSPALIQFQKGLEVEANQVDLLNGIARVLRKQGKVDQAIEKARSVLRVNSNSLDAYNTLGLCYLAQGELELARFVFLKAEASVPGGDESASIQANMGLVFFKMDKEFAAEERFNRARQLDPDHVGAMVNLAYLKLKNYDFEGARALLEQAHRVLPASNAIKLDLAVSLRGTGDHDRARQLYEEIVLAKDQFLDDALMNLGILLADHYQDYGAALSTYLEYKEAVRGQGAEVADDAVVHDYIAEVERALKREQKRRERDAKKKAKDAGAAPNPGTSAESGGQ